MIFVAEFLLVLLAKHSSKFCLFEVFIPYVIQEVFLLLFLCLLLGNWNKNLYTGV
jgi:hypothetical protein